MRVSVASVFAYSLQKVVVLSNILCDSGAFQHGNTVWTAAEVDSKVRTLTLASLDVLRSKVARASAQLGLGYVGCCNCAIARNRALRRKLMKGS